MSARWDRAAAAVAVVVGLLLVVGASARRPLNGGDVAPALPTWPLLFVTGVGFVVAAALGIAVLGPIMRVRGELPGRTALRAGPLTLGLSLLLPAAIIALYSTHGPGGERKAIGPQTTHAQKKPVAEDDGDGDHAAGIAALTAGVGAGVVGLAGFALVRARHRRREDLEPRAAVAQGAREAAEAAAIPADPRAAVLAAYARMESALAAVGLARRPSDAPREYLARLEAGLGGGGAPAGQLTALFERARFSPHPIGEEDRREAIGALESLRIELEAPA